MTPQVPPTWQRWQRLFAQPAASASAASTARPPFRRVPLVPTGTDTPTARAGSGMPPSRPTPPVDGRPLPPEPPPLRGRVLAGTGFPHSRSRWSLAHPRRALELAWLTCYLPEPMREAVLFNLRQTLDWRAQQCKPLKAPKTPHLYTRFGLLGEQLQPKGANTLSKKLRAELREMIRVVEGSQSRTERNRLLAMHSIRLGQLCAELEERGIDALEKLRLGLTWLWN